MQSVPGQISKWIQIELLFHKQMVFGAQAFGFPAAFGAMRPSCKKVSCWTNLLRVKPKSEVTPRSSREFQTQAGAETASRRVWLEFAYNKQLNVCIVVVVVVEQSVWVFLQPKGFAPTLRFLWFWDSCEKHRHLFISIMAKLRYIYIYITRHLNILMRNEVSKPSVVHFTTIT